MTEQLKHYFDSAAQDFSEARQILDGAIGEKRGMSAEETNRYNKHFNAACDSREVMKKLKAEEMAASIATMQGELAEMINSGGEGPSEGSRRGGRMYHEMYNAESVPYRWNQQGPISLRRSGIQIESAVPNPAAKADWSFLEKRGSRKYQEEMEAYFAHPGPGNSGARLRIPASRSILTSWAAFGWLRSR